MKIYLTPLEIVVALYNVSINTEQDTGADRTYRQIVHELNGKRMAYPKDLVESVLYFCNMNDEEGEFWHPLDMTFKAYAKRICADNNVKFNSYFNYLERNDISACKKN